MDAIIFKACSVAVFFSFSAQSCENQLFGTSSKHNSSVDTCFCVQRCKKIENDIMVEQQYSLDDLDENIIVAHIFRNLENKDLEVVRRLSKKFNDLAKSALSQRKEKRYEIFKGLQRLYDIIDELDNKFKKNGIDLHIRNCRGDSPGGWFLPRENSLIIYDKAERLVTPWGSIKLMEKEGNSLLGYGVEQFMYKKLKKTLFKWMARVMEYPNAHYYELKSGVDFEQLLQNDLGKDDFGRVRKDIFQELSKNELESRIGKDCFLRSDIDCLWYKIHAIENQDLPDLEEPSAQQGYHESKVAEKEWNDFMERYKKETNK